MSFIYRQGADCSGEGQLSATLDQAASLRAWALDRAQQTQTDSASTAGSAGHRQLVVIGLPGGASGHVGMVQQRLQRWAEHGYRWVGDPLDWSVIPVGPDSASPALPEVQCKRWALWVGADIHAFEHAYQALKLVSAARAPRKILALHEPGWSRKGLLDNLSRIAEHYCDRQLVVLAQ